MKKYSAPEMKALDFVVEEGIAGDVISGQGGHNDNAELW